MDTSTTETDLLVILGAAIGALHRFGTSDRVIRATTEGAIKAARMFDTKRTQ
jgi:fluoride ion exporter CrcB/FEX